MVLNKFKYELNLFFIPKIRLYPINFRSFINEKHEYHHYNHPIFHLDF